MTTHSWVIIANPMAGRGLARKLAPQLVQTLSDAGEKVALHWTESADHAESLARDAALAGISRIVACGGDGTIHQVINGTMAAGPTNPEAAMGIVPAGHCNDLATSLALPKHPKNAAQCLLNGNLRRIDLGRAGARYFATVATLGFDTEVGRYVADGRPPFFLRGKAAYLYGTLITLARYRDVEVHLRGDFGEFHGPIFMAAIGNTPNYGGGMKIAPTAVLDDGWLDLCLVKSVPKLDVVRMLPRIFSGGHVKHHAVSLKHLRRLEIESSEPLWVRADGEPITQTPTTIEVVPHALSVLVPPGAVEKGTEA